jgi:hypothetical protein
LKSLDTKLKSAPAFQHLDATAPLGRRLRA